MMFVMLRTADAHAHFCFDGKEPPTSIHMADGDTHPCETDPSKGHTGDKDVQLSPDVVAKKPVPSDAWLPYAIAFVTLREGPTILTSLVDTDLDAIAIGQQVRLGFEERDGQPVPVFRPV